MSQVHSAQSGVITPQMQGVAQYEEKDLEFICEGVATGSIVLMNRGDLVTGIGCGLKTKVNVNIGTSSGRCYPEEEIQKAIIAEQYGADTISDLSTAGDISEIRRSILKVTSLPLTTVPIYQAVAEHTLDMLTEEAIIENVQNQAQEDISSFVLHCVSSRIITEMKRTRRILGVVSKGGSMMASFMMKNGVENPYITHFDEILSIIKDRDIVLSLGNTMRSGCIHDTRDTIQLMEIEENVALAQRAHEAGVQVIIEGAGGHIRADMIPEVIRYHKTQAPYPLFVAGPLPTDVAMGYDHIAGCVGASIASGAGADYLCYITGAEHKGLPTPEQVKEGLIAFRIAAHIGDSMKYGPDSRDAELARCRARMDWEGQAALALDPEAAQNGVSNTDECTMCGSFCAIKMMNRYVMQS